MAEIVHRVRCARPIASGSALDWRFRGTARVLSDLARDELVALAQLISGLRRVQLETGRNWLTVTVTRREDAPAPVVSIEPSEPEGQRIDVVESVHARRLFGLLKSNQLADDASSGYADSIAGPDVMVIGRKMLAHLSELLRDVSTV